MKITVPKFSDISTFLAVFLFIFFGIFIYIFLFSISTISPNLSALRAGSAHDALSLWLSLVSPLAKFFGFDPGAAGLPCMSPLGLGLSLGRSLSIWEGYIHWLVPTGATWPVTWSGAVTRQRPAGASVPAASPAE